MYLSAIHFFGFYPAQVRSAMVAMAYFVFNDVIRIFYHFQCFSFVPRLSTRFASTFLTIVLYFFLQAITGGWFMAVMTILVQHPLSLFHPVHQTGYPFAH